MPTRAPRPSRQKLLLLGGLLLLAACAAPSAPPSQSGTGAGSGAPAASTPATPGSPPARNEPLRSLGLIQVHFDHIGDGELSATATGVDAQGQALPVLGAQGLTDQTSGIQLQALSSGSFTTGTRGTDGMRYLYATFRVRNASTAGTAYASARQNLTLLAASTPGTIGESAVGAMLRFDGTPAAPAIAATILPTHGMAYNRSTDAAGLLPGGEDLQVYGENELSTLALPAGVTRLFPYGYVVRRQGITTTRSLPASPAAGQYDGLVTIAMRLPLQATSAEDPFSLNYTMEVVDDSVTRVTESPEEQGAQSTAASRAALLGAGTQIATLCGSGYTGSGNVFVGSATTAGNAPGSRLAHIGGELALQEAAPATPAVGNTSLSVNAASGLLSHFKAYPAVSGGAAPTATIAGVGATTSGGGSFVVAGSGAFDYTPPVGLTGTTDSFGYTVTAGGCTTPTLSATLPISNRVWYVNSAAASAGDGRSATPFQSLAGLNGKTAASDFIYLLRGNGSLSGSGLTLQNSQQLIGEGADLIVGGRTLRTKNPSGGPTLTLSGQALTVATDNTVKGLTLNGSSGGLSGSSFGTLTLADLTVGATAGPALDLSSGAVASSGTLVTNSSASPSHGLNLNNVTGTLNLTGGSLSGAVSAAPGVANNGLNLTLSSGSLTLGLSALTLSGNDEGGLNAVTTGSGGLNLTLQNSTLGNNLGEGVLLSLSGSAGSTYVLNNNTLTNTAAAAVTGGFAVADLSPSGTVNKGRISNNTVNLLAGAATVGTGIKVSVDSAGRTLLALSGNTVRNHGTYGVSLGARSSSGRLDVTGTGNTVLTGSAQGLEGFNFQAGDATPGESPTLCLNLSGASSLPGPAPTDGYVLRQRAGTTLLLDGGTPTLPAWFGSKSNTGSVRLRTPTPTPAAGSCTPPGI